MDIRVTTWCLEADGRWGERVIRWDLDVEEPETAGVWGALVSGTFEDGFPDEEICVA